MKEHEITARVSFEDCRKAAQEIYNLRLAAYDRRDAEIARLSESNDFEQAHAAADAINREIEKLDLDNAELSKVWRTNVNSGSLFGLLTGDVEAEYTITEAELDRVCEIVRQYM